MSKKTYSTPTITSEKVDVGVFGSYGSSGSDGGLKISKRSTGRNGHGIFSWSIWPWNW